MRDATGNPCERSIWSLCSLYSLDALTLTPSPRKKLAAIFTLENGRTRTVHFGAAGASDFTQHRDPARKQRYLARHAPREDYYFPVQKKLYLSSLPSVKLRSLWFAWGTLEL